MGNIIGNILTKVKFFYPERFNGITLGMNSSRIEWNDEDSKTYVKDQFFVDIWEPIAQTGQTIKLDITCEMVVCPVAAFAREDDEYSSESICWLNTAGTNFKSINLRGWPVGTFSKF